MSPKFWNRKKVLLTGHTGFKGTWMSVLLLEMGAEVYGFSLPGEQRELYMQMNFGSELQSNHGDVADIEAVDKLMHDIQPEIIIHMAAQSLVRPSYSDPVNTFQTNVIGTLNILECVKHCESVKAVLVVTTDKCYENKEKIAGYVESDPLGGHDPYSSSKACAELVVNCYQKSYFDVIENSTLVASARAGNVLGGGDFSVDRIIPDLVKAISNNTDVNLRNPQSIRPWQHVLDPLTGYLMICERLFAGENSIAQAWNFGPDPQSHVCVEELVRKALSYWAHEEGRNICTDTSVQPVETNVLTLDSSKAKNILGWKPLLNFEETVEWTIEWYRRSSMGENSRDLITKQIKHFIDRL